MIVRAKALGFMENALRLLDQAKAAPWIGAHLDLAICRLREEMGNTETSAASSWDVPPKDEVGI
jgi:hypothetical protein